MDGERKESQRLIVYGLKNLLNGYGRASTLSYTHTHTHTITHYYNLFLVLGPEGRGGRRLQQQGEGRDGTGQT